MMQYIVVVLEVSWLIRGINHSTNLFFYTAAMERIVNGAPIPQLSTSMPNTFHPLYPPSITGVNQLGYSLPPQAPPLHQPLQAPQPHPFQQFFGTPLPVGVGQVQPPPGANDPASQRPLALPPNASVNNPEPGPPSMSGPPIASSTSAGPSPPRATPKLGKRTPVSPSKDQRKRGEAETPAGNEASSERATTKRKAPTQQVGDSDAPTQSSKRARKGRK